MFIQTKQKLKAGKIIYLTLSLLFNTSLQIQARGNSLELEEEHMTENRRYNFIGVAIFNGESFTSNVIKKATSSRASHAGLLISNVENENEWFCFEATGSGVRLSSFTKGYIDHYKGHVSYRLAVFEDRDRPNSEQVTQFVDEFLGKRYPGPKKLINAVYGKNIDTEYNDSSSIFCSELVAHAFKWLDILREEGASSNCLPCDFKSNGAFDKNFLFQVELTDEFDVK